MKGGIIRRIRNMRFFLAKDSCFLSLGAYVVKNFGYVAIKKSEILKSEIGKLPF